MSEVEQEFEIVSEYKTLSFQATDPKIDVKLNEYGLYGWRVVSTWTTTHSFQFETVVYVNILLECQTELPIDEIHRLQNLYTNPSPLTVEKPNTGNNAKEKWDKIKQRFGAASASLDNQNDDDEDDVPRQWP